MSRRRGGRRRGDWLARYLSPGETVRLETRQHPAAILGSVLEAVGLAAPLTLVAWGAGGFAVLRGAPYRTLLGLIALLLLGVLVRLAWRVLAWEHERVLVTDEKVVHVHGVLSRRIASTPIAKVSEFSVRQPLLGRILGFGSLVVDVPGGREQALHGCDFLPDPTAVYRMVSGRGAAAQPVVVEGEAPTTVMQRVEG
jgi:uncharacterized membrane protein YdbT with pleckstrin-like domain